MLTTSSIRQEPTTSDDVYAFQIFGEVGAEDMSAMADYMNTQFDRHDSVSMLLIFARYGGSESGANFDWETIKSRIRSIGKVDRYAVVGAPEQASRLIEGLSRILPVNARAFEDEEAAWEFVGARPLPARPDA